MCVAAQMEPERKLGAMALFIRKSLYESSYEGEARKACVGRIVRVGMHAIEKGLKPCAELRWGGSRSRLPNGLGNHGNAFAKSKGEGLCHASGSLDGCARVWRTGLWGP